MLSECKPTSFLPVKFSVLNRVVDWFPFTLTALFGGKMSQSESSRKHYLKNRAARIADKNARKKRNADYIREYKRTHLCSICGESEPCCLDFHHTDQSQKSDVLGRMAHRGRGLKFIIEEIAKCEILCANCHRKFHFGPVAHLGERCTCNAEAAGAEPVRSTKFEPT